MIDNLDKKYLVDYNLIKILNEVLIRNGGGILKAS